MVVGVAVMTVKVVTGLLAASGTGVVAGMGGGDGPGCRRADQDGGDGRHVGHGGDGGVAQVFGRLSALLPWGATSDLGEHTEIMPSGG